MLSIFLLLLFSYTEVKGSSMVTHRNERPSALGGYSRGIDILSLELATDSVTIFS